jgi:aminopeptidase N
MMVKKNKRLYIVSILWYLLMANTTLAYTRADSLRGANGTGRNWWDVQQYNLAVTFDTAGKSITGTNWMKFVLTDDANDSLQIDLQEPMVIDKVLWQGKEVLFERDGNVWWIKNDFSKLKKGDSSDLHISYHGVPHEAKTPPWDGGFIWGKDSMGNAWYSVACQGLGASVWWPCKDIQSDEPDNGMDISLNIPEGMSAISNGLPIATPTIEKGYRSTWKWQVKNPINIYDVSFYIGDYIHITDTLHGEKGVLKVDFYALKHNDEKARGRFAEIKQMLRCFEFWMGPYPFYEDGYKLVDAPFLGMEHQSGIAYGNKYQMGYLGRDRSGTGAGMDFDFIIIHESGHEWYGNNITAKDIADNWIHEGFTTYTETLFEEWIKGKDKAYKYLRGQRRNILNNIPIIGPYGVQGHGSGDMYDKGATIVHMIRVAMNNDKAFRSMLREMNRKYYHSFTTSAEIEKFIIWADEEYNKKRSLKYEPFFEQYLRTTKVPELEYHIKDGKLNYRFTNIVNGFTLPIQATDGKTTVAIEPTAEWRSVKWKGGYNVKFSEDFYFTIKG